ncbi:MAG: rhodanese-like domain-containing protein [Ignavibacteria bacterium]|nr:rhodanese-like domain-containing protein [Ignavibacteria bacterium]
MKALFLFSVFSLSLILLSPDVSQSQSTAEYVCYPCGSECDEVIYFGEGKCRECRMPLIEKSRVVFRNISPSELLSKLKFELGFILIDVRSAEEFDGEGKGQQYLQGYKHFNNAINIPSDELEKRISEIKDLKNSEIIVYCSHNNRSPYSSQILTDAGFSNVTNLMEGIKAFADDYLINSDKGRKYFVK